MDKMGDISIVIPSSNRFCHISDKRVERLLDSNKKIATYMGVWERIIDFFRTEKKSEALEQLYDFIHANHLPEEGKEIANTDPITNKIQTFNKLKSLANNKDKKLFFIEKNNRDGIDFYIGTNLITSLDYCALDYVRYQLNANPNTKGIVTHPEAEKYLYDLIDGTDAQPHGDWVIISDPIPKMIAAFDKLKLLANDDQKNGFYIGKNERDGIDFYIDSVLIKSLDHCQSNYALYQLNNCPEMKKNISNTVKNVLMTRKQPTLENLVIDMIRKNEYSAIDGEQLVNNTNDDKEKTRELTLSFYDSLTLPQQKAIREVGSQNGIANIINTLESVPNNFSDNYIHMNAASSTVMYHNDNSSDITVIQTFRREASEKYYELRKILQETENKEDKYPTLQMDAAFTISSNGDVKCSLLHVSDEVRLPAFSLDELKLAISHQTS